MSSSPSEHAVTADKITCPGCGMKIPVTHALEQEITERLGKEMAEKVGQQERELFAKSKELEKREEEVKKQTVEMETQVLRRIETEKEKMGQEMIKRAEEKYSLELQNTKSALLEKDQKLEAARQKELELLKHERELEDKEKSRELEMVRTLTAERSKIEEETSKRIQEENRLKEMEKEKQINDMRRTIDDLKRKAEQSSQQMQGEVQELDLELFLRTKFPYDVIETVPTGINGADIIQRIHTRNGICCGSIVWESKRTKAWSQGWIEKLKEDQRAVNADIAIIVSDILPKEITDFGEINGVWITSYPFIFGLTTVLREMITQIYRTRSMMEGQDEKKDILFRYLTGQEFRQRMEAIVDAFKGMSEDLDQEKRAMTRSWAKREKQIERMTMNTARMYGDLQGYIGSTLPTISQLAIGMEEELIEEKPIPPSQNSLFTF